jgi:hypothetical protein
MAYQLPWKGDYHVVAESADVEAKLKQRITRAFEKAQDSGVCLGEEFMREWEINTLADELVHRIKPFFKVE